MDAPPPLLQPVASKRKRAWVVGGVIVGVSLAIILGGYFFIQSVIASGITEGPDHMFGDQHLKTTVALIELHKVRFGRYPETLKDLKFTGQWDQIALGSVAYWTNTDGTKYFVEVQRGWIGKPKLQMPAEFWRGTGYSEALRQVDH